MWAGVNQWMLPRLAAGTQMDVATNLGGAGLFGDSDWFMDVGEILNTPNEYVAAGKAGSEKWIDQYPTYLMSSNSVVNSKGQIVAVPYMLDCGAPTAIFYNKSIFAELEITPPKTWEEMFAACEKIKAAGLYSLRSRSRQHHPRPAELGHPVLARPDFCTIQI